MAKFQTRSDKEIRYHHNILKFEYCERKLGP